MINNKPTVADADVQHLRIKLIEEEFDEFTVACFTGDLVGMADALGDLLYVTLGACVSFGIDITPVFEEIHKSNMAKLGGPKRADGKQLKPEGWQPPDIESILAAQSLRDTQKMDCVWYYDFEVIGNIYENPELLEVQNA